MRKIDTPVAPKQPYVKPEPTWIALLPQTVAAFVVRYRWQLAPVAAASAVFTVSQASGPVINSLWTTITACLLWFTKERKIGTRMYLSTRERETIVHWLTLVALWSMWTVLGIGTIWTDLALLIVAVAWPTWRWVCFRIPPRRKRISIKSKERMGMWADKVARIGHDPLKGSSIIGGSATEPAEGALSFLVRLREDVHNGVASGEQCRQSVEALLALPADCVTIDRVKDDAGRIRVTMSPARHLENGTVEWRGPEINTKTGVAPIGLTPDGRTVEVAWFNKDGVYHGRVMGNSGNGKSSSLRVVLSAYLTIPNASLWLIDGKRGTSIPEMRSACDVYSIKDREWASIIDALYRVMVARQDRRGEQGKSFWRTGEEDDPNITLVIEESAEVRRILSKDRTSERQVLAILQQGRALGISIVQCSQDSEATNLLGGRMGRELMANGLNILHRPGGKEGNRMAGDAFSEKVNLLGLPDEPGFAAVVMAGKVAAEVCRIRYADQEAFTAWAASYGDPVSLTGADLVAAGPAYARRGLPVTEVQEPIVVTDDEIEELLDDEIEQSEAEVSEVQAWIIKVLTLDGARTLGELVTEGGGVRGRGRTHIKNNLRSLNEAGRVFQGDGAKWSVSK